MLELKLKHIQQGTVCTSIRFRESNKDFTPWALTEASIGCVIKGLQ
jgi:hypothetical protein